MEHRPSGVSLEAPRDMVRELQRKSERFWEYLRFLKCMTLCSWLSSPLSSNLLSSVAKLYRRQNVICEQEFVFQCSQQLLDAKETPSDRWIHRYLQVTILSRRVSDMFNYHDPTNGKIMGEGSICAVVDSFKLELDQLKQSIQEEAFEQGKNCQDYRISQRDCIQSEGMFV